MSKITGCLFIMLMLFSAWFANYGCGPRAAPPVTPAPTLAVSHQAKAGWEVDWENVQQAAGREGKLVILSDMGSALREKVGEVFAARYGVSVEFIAGRPAEFATKLLREFRAGLYVGDVYASGVTTAIITLKPAGILETLDPLLILPEVTDGQSWWAGRLPFSDKDHTHIGFLSTVVPPVTINTDLVKTDEIKSFRDLLEPRWKGKMVLNDPSIGGTGLGAFTALAESIMDLEFLRALGRQEPVVNRDSRLQVEWIARGKYPIGLFIKQEEVLNFIRAGAPIKYIIPKEGSYVSSSTGGVSILKNAPHPNASKLYINWILSKEGQTLFSQMHGGQSARVDVPTEHVMAEYRRQPGINYWIDSSEEATTKKEKYMEVAKEMYGHLMK